MKRYYLIVFIIAIGIVINFYQNNRNLPKAQNVSQKEVFATPNQSSTQSAVLGVQTKTTGCIALNGLPDSSCTPGAIFTDAVRGQICAGGYSTSVRNVPQSEKDSVYKEYGILSHTTGQYEVDHLISLELGGSNDISNLWPEAASPKPGFHEKDMVENYLHAQVCNGTVTLQEAQKEISTNWLEVYNKMPKN